MKKLHADVNENTSFKRYYASLSTKIKQYFNLQGFHYITFR